MSRVDPDPRPDVALVGAGVMSATLGALLKDLDPALKVEMFESLEGPALESSNSWNNAGTGHAANCELNYTPLGPDGAVDISKALEVNAEFDLSRQLWAHLVRTHEIAHPRSFIHPVPHMSFVRGAGDAAFLRKRFEALTAHHCYDGMEYTEDRARLAEWVPLVMEGRLAGEPVAATRIASGADVDYGSLTRSLVRHLARLEGFAVHYRHRVADLRREPGGRWRLEVEDLARGGRRALGARFVYLGAGGGALPLLQRSGIPEAAGYGGFPVSGLWLRCDDPPVAERHHAKVYGKAAVGSPPMSVPHLDTRVIGGKRSLLFGPFAGFSTKFLKRGSYLDLLRSLTPGNIGPMLAAGRDNLRLTEYLVGQVFQSAPRRFAALREYYPLARREDWRLEVAGQRVQVIKPDARRGGILEFGTELVSSADRSLVALLGASPGASTAVFTSIRVLEQSFKAELAGRWLPKLKAMVPSYGRSLDRDPALCRRLRAETAEVLQLAAA